MRKHNEPLYNRLIELLKITNLEDIKIEILEKNIEIPDGDTINKSLDLSIIYWLNDLHTILSSDELVKENLLKIYVKHKGRDVKVHSADKAFDIIDEVGALIQTQVKVPESIEELKKQAVKVYEYIYTGHNVDILKFNITYQNNFIKL